MISIDKNDVDISKLFNWGKKLDILDSNGEIIESVHIRVVGDETVNKARVYALRKSAELRRKLKEEDSDERIAYIPDMTDIPKENIAAVVVNSQVTELGKDIIRNINVPVPQEPGSGASLEDQEKYQKAVDEWPEKREKAIEKALDNEVKRLNKVYEKYSKEELKQEYENSLIGLLCETEMLNKFNEYIACHSAYADANFKTKLFSSVEEFQDLSPLIKDQFIEFYGTLDINVEELKKSPEATQ